MPGHKERISELEAEKLLLRREIEALRETPMGKSDQEDQVNGLERFRTIFDESPFGNKIIDADLTMIKVNKKLLEMLRYEQSELVGRRIVEFTTADFIEPWTRLREELWLISNPCTSFSIECCLVRKDRTLVQCQVTSIIFIDGGQRLGYTIVEDITLRLEDQRLRVELISKQLWVQLKEVELINRQEILELGIRTQEEERERIAEQLHNSLGQLLYAMKIHLNLVKKGDVTEATNAAALSEVSKILSQSMEECRRTAHHLLPAVLNDFGLKEALEDLCRQFAPSIVMKFHFRSIKAVHEKYAEIVIFRSVQELFLNIVKHAEASQGSCSIDIGRNKISVTVTDNGKGFDLNRVKKNGIGISALKARIEQMTGTLDVESRIGKGTKIHISFPRRKF